MTEPNVERDAAVPGHAAGDASVPGDTAGDASLLALVDRLAGLLERSDLLELEVEAGGTGLILRKPAALATTAAALPAGDPGQPADTAARTERAAAGTSGGTGSWPGPASGAASGASTAPGAAADARLAVRAPLTGIFYSSPGPGSPPFVAVGREVVVGQVIGLIEAMKLFNEIKSDQAGRVVRVIAEDGALVKAKQPLIEVGPL
jgi:acetyl-CoA carboxylase biotin carboxyl carrier protein